MRYKGVTFSCNPLSIRIKSEIKKASATVPFEGERVKAMGRKCRVITGKGELCGEDCLQQYARLYSLLTEGGAGVLSLPTAPPMYAFFTELSALADTAPDKIEYSFEFIESDSFCEGNGVKLHIVNEGETLFDIAYDRNTTVDSLVRLNPQVKRPDELIAGEEIKLC